MVCGEPRSIPVNGSQSVKAQRSVVWMEVSGHRSTSERQHVHNRYRARDTAERLQAQYARFSTTRQVETAAGPRTVNHSARAARDRDLGPELTRASIIAAQISARGRLQPASTRNGTAVFSVAAARRRRDRLSRQEGKGRGDPKLKEFCAQPLT